jgi:hypothetical protein
MTEVAGGGRTLFVDLKFVGFGDPAALILQLEDVEAADEVGEIDLGLGIDHGDFVYFSAEKIIDLKRIGFVGIVVEIFVEFEGDIGNRGVGVKLYDLGFGLRNREPGLAFGLGGCH